MSIVVKCPACGIKNRIKEDISTTPLCGRCKTPIILQKNRGPIILTDTDFDNYIRNSNKPVLVDFWADWCIPCKVLAPVLESFAKSQQSIKVAKLDTEQNPLSPSKFQIFSIPTMILFVNGKEIKRITGALTLRELETALRPWITIN